MKNNYICSYIFICFSRIIIIIYNNIKFDDLCVFKINYEKWWIFEIYKKFKEIDIKVKLFCRGYNWD